MYSVWQGMTRLWIKKINKMQWNWMTNSSYMAMYFHYIPLASGPPVWKIYARLSLCSASFSCCCIQMTSCYFIILVQCNSLSTSKTSIGISPADYHLFKKFVLGRIDLYSTRLETNIIWRSFTTFLNCMHRLCQVCTLQWCKIKVNISVCMLYVWPTLLLLLLLMLWQSPGLPGWRKVNL